MTRKNPLSFMLPLFLVLFIDGMGLGLLFPILNAIIIEPNAGFIELSVNLNQREVLYGFIVGIFMLCWFFGAAYLGDLSDSIGRRKALLICLIGAFIGYFLSAIAIVKSSIGLLIVGRMIAGFTAGSQPIAQAAIVDVSSEEHKARNIGFILLAVSLGFVFGPIFGGVLSDTRIWHGFGFQTPLYFASCLSLFNAILLWAFFKETFQKTKKVNLKWHHALYVFISAFRHPGIKKLSFVLLIMIFGWSNYFSFISLYMLQHYHHSILENSLFMACLGLGFSVGCGYIVEYCTHRYQSKNIVCVMLMATALEVLIILIFDVPIVPWIMTFFIGTTLATAYSVLLTMFSNQVNENEQGWVMGVTGSIMALCFGLTSFSTGLLAHVGAWLPLAMAVVGLSFSGLLLQFIFKSE